MIKKISKLFFVLIGAVLIGACSSAQNTTTQATDMLLENFPEAEAAVSAAKQALAERLNVEASTIILVSIEEVQWADSCLGVTLPDLACAQVITPGYKIIFDVGGNPHELHTDETGEAIAFATQEAK